MRFALLWFTSAFAVSAIFAFANLHLHSLKAPTSDRALANDGLIELPTAPINSSVALIRLGDEPLCSGIAIDSNTVLSAAHCLLGIDSPELFARLSVSIGGTTIGRKYRVFVPRSFEVGRRPTLTEGDIALFQFESSEIQDALSASPPVALADGSLKLKKEMRFFTSGFGPSSLIDHLDGKQGILRTNELMLLDADNSDLITTVNRPGSRICGGDSGSPLFVESDGTQYLAGILSGSRSELREGPPREKKPGDPRSQASFACEEEIGEAYWTSITKMRRFISNPKSKSLEFRDGSFVPVVNEK